MPFLLYTDPQVVPSGSLNISYSKVTIEGELTIYEALEFKEKLDSVFRDCFPFLEIDLFKIQKIDTSCLQILLSFKKEAQRINADIRFVNYSHVVSKLIDFYELSGLLNNDSKLSKSLQLEASKD
ncbi:STAS domain-containing protein [Leptospira mayottensis]|uniref:STAS domain protein n=2 Tax=Leptospira mayottensis TaxID=1137606 RepID=A0AA87MSD7_9LEPT|nr:STAS domain-containing protein [Leptospira mayottensis]AXR61549.1 anti-sigma factor antagonist [Leptospira mayottensis]AXR65186.1 anti-sigma factor antagonist [Leptospira mayottensis]AZQ02011.1 anti-sigma factor antagonist [Leptospira mayottensis 200901116]EKS01601.1 STAS domain protein [Leptospira mayottensis 200901122]TGN13571.1 anti-sigma factor antagonist [Leptospira mayottensis]